MRCDKCLKELPDAPNNTNSLVEKHLRTPIYNVSYKDIDYFIEHSCLPPDSTDEYNPDNTNFCDLDHLYRFISLMEDTRDGRWWK